MEIESWYYADRQNTSDRNQFHCHYRQNIAHEPPLEQIHISKVKNEQQKCSRELAGSVTSGAVAQTWLTVSPVELWHRTGWLYHQWSCGTDMADFTTNVLFTSRILIGQKLNLLKEQRHKRQNHKSSQLCNGLIHNISASLHDNQTEKRNFLLCLILPISFQAMWLS